MGGGEMSDEKPNPDSTQFKDGPPALPPLINPTSSTQENPQNVDSQRPSTTGGVDWSSEDRSKDQGKEPQKQPAYHNDPAFFRLVTNFAGWALILSVCGMLWLAGNEKDIPEGVVAVASGLVGLLTGIFAAKSSQT